MSDRGTLIRSEAIRFWLTLYDLATGTPTITITRSGNSVLTAQNMTQGADASEWYYDYTTGGSATVGKHEVKYIAVVNGITKYIYDTYDQSVDNLDSIGEDTDAILGNQGPGGGAFNATINVKDDVPANVENAYVTIHNVSDDDTPIVANGYTDASGNVTLNIDGNIYVRVKKSGFTFTSTAVNVTSSTTYYVTGEVLAYGSVPGDPDLCRLYLYPVTLGGDDITDLIIEISTDGILTKVDEFLVSNTSGEFTYDVSTDPDSYYFDAYQGSVVRIFCEKLSIDKRDIVVPAVASKNISDLL